MLQTNNLLKETLTSVTLRRDPLLFFPADGTSLLIESLSHEIMRLRVAAGGLAIFAVLATFVAIGMAITG